MEVDDLFTDEKSENEGVWVDAGEYLPSMAGLELKVARLLNPAFSKMMQEEAKNAGAKYDTDTKVQMAVMIKVYSHTILKGWKGLTDKGKAVKFNQETAQRYLTGSTDLRNVVTRISQDRQRYRAQREEADRKN